MVEVNPLSVILVKSDSKGDRLLFRFPYDSDGKDDGNQKNRRRNPYAVTISEDLLQTSLPQNSNITRGNITGLGDEVLSNLFAVKAELCEQKFELKVNDVRFVGHPTLFQSGSLDRMDKTLGSSSTVNHSDTPSAILINVVFALHSYANHSVVKCYYDLSKRLGIALKHEEKRCCYVTIQTKDMMAAHDEIAHKLVDAEDSIANIESPFELILQRCSLARDLTKVFQDLSSTGLVQLRVNNWIEVSFCLPHKVHQAAYMHRGFLVEPDSIDKCLKAVRPYHGLLLLVDQAELLESLPPDSSPALLRLIQVYSPLKSLQTSAADADITLQQVFQLTGHLVYWAKAMVIYPLCENNVYAIAPDASTSVVSPLMDKFAEKFPGESLLQVMSDFSLPTSLNQRMSPLAPPGQHKQLVQMIAWMVQHRLLLQLHTYVYLMPTSKGQAVSRSCREIQQYKGESFIEEDKPSAIPKHLLDSLSSDEMAAIMRVPAASNMDDVHLLLRLFSKGYLNGKHHLEDIMYFENIKRSQLLQILDKFRDVLVLCEVEDPAISMFYSH